MATLKSFCSRQEVFHQLVVTQPDHAERGRKVARVVEDESLDGSLERALVSPFEHISKAASVEILRQRLLTAGKIVQGG